MVASSSRPSSLCRNMFVDSTGNAYACQTRGNRDLVSGRADCGPFPLFVAAELPRSNFATLLANGSLDPQAPRHIRRAGIDRLFTDDSPRRPKCPSSSSSAELPPHPLSPTPISRGPTATVASGTPPIHHATHRFIPHAVISEGDFA